MRIWTGEEEQQLREQVKKHGKDWIAVAKMLGKTHGAVRKKWYALAKLSKEAGDDKKSKLGVNLQEFLANNDPDTRSRLAIRRCLKDIGDRIVKDGDMRNACGAAANGWRQIADEAEFKGHQFTIDGRIFWARPAVVAKAVSTVRKAKRLE